MSAGMLVSWLLFPLYLVQDFLAQGVLLPTIKMDPLTLINPLK